MNIFESFAFSESVAAVRRRVGFIDLSLLRMLRSNSQLMLRMASSYFNVHFSHHDLVIKEEYLLPKERKNVNNCIWEYLWGHNTPRKRNQLDKNVNRTMIEHYFRRKIAKWYFCIKTCQFRSKNDEFKRVFTSKKVILWLKSAIFQSMFTSFDKNIPFCTAKRKFLTKKGQVLTKRDNFRLKWPIFNNRNSETDKSIFRGRCNSRKIWSKFSKFRRVKSFTNFENF